MKFRENSKNNEEYKEEFIYFDYTAFGDTRDLLFKANLIFQFYKFCKF